MKTDQTALPRTVIDLLKCNAVLNMAQNRTINTLRS